VNIFTALITFALLFLTGCAKASAPDGNAIYDSNRTHLWNRLNETLFERTAPNGKHYGLNQLDILYWTSTTNLLSGPSHEQALAVLNKFINSHGEKLIQDPLKKALLQRDLWALFDWVAVKTPYYQAQFPKERRELESRLAVVIHRLALTTNEIASLPDNYLLAEKNHLSDLPLGLFYTNGSWISVTVNNTERLVPAHDIYFGGRSVFTVWFRDADGHKAGLDYLKQTSSIKPMFVPSTNPNFSDSVGLNPALPQFPTNSQWALARCMCVIDTEGRIQPTHIVESIQLRTYLRIGKFTGIFEVDETNPPQRFNEFQMTRDSQANLISLPQNGMDFVFVHFQSMGIDAFENRQVGKDYDVTEHQGRVLGTCVECHSASGIHSVNSFTRLFSGNRPTETTQMVESAPKREEETTLQWKERQFDWGFLQGLWTNSSSP
jgi:hypothetical protein